MNPSSFLIASMVTLVALAAPAGGADFYTDFQSGFFLRDMNGQQGWECDDPTPSAGHIVNLGSPGFSSRSATLGYVSPLVNNQVYLNHAASTPLAAGPMNAGFSVLFYVRDSDSGLVDAGAGNRDTFGFRLENAAGENLFTFLLTPFAQHPTPQLNTRFDVFSWSSGNATPSPPLLGGAAAEETYAYTLTVHFSPSGVNDVAFVGDINGAQFTGIIPGRAGEMITKLGAIWIPLGGPAEPGSNFIIFDKIGVKSEPLNLVGQVAGDFTYTSDGSAVTLIRYNGAGGAVTIPAMIGNLPVTTLWNSLFAGRTDLTSITLPAGLTTVGSSAFEGCTGLTSVTLPATVTALGNFAFSGCTNLADVFAMGNAPSVGTGVFAQATTATVYYLPGTSDWGSELGGRPALLWGAEITVEQPAGTVLADGTASIDCGPADLGSSAAPLTFTVKNTGTAALTGLALMQDGPESADFTVSELTTTSLASGASTTFTVTFAPGATGTRTAALHLASNDADESPFDITLTGIGVGHPEITVEEPAGTILVDGTASIDCGTADLGSSVVPLTFIVKNAGTAALTGLTLTQDGPESADFTVSALTATALAPGETTTFAVTFAPGAAGTRTAALHLASNDADENPFDIALTGTGRAAVESWRLANFGTTESVGIAADDEDPDGDSMSNLIEYGFKMNPHVPNANPVTGRQSSASLVILYPRNLAATDVTFTIDESSDLGQADPWLAAAVTEEILSTADGVQQIKATLALAPGTPSAFARVKLVLKP